LLLGELDESLKTAFDFDYWMRAFRAYPGQIGFVDRIQAQSRLHKDCITLRQRKKALIEGVQVLARHLGSAPPEWVLTYVDEISSELALEFLTEVRGCLRPEDEAQLLEKFGRSVLSEQAGNISMPTSQAISEFNLLRFILVIRHDLREKHGFDLESNLNRYLGWVLQAGLGEYRALAENIPLIQALIARGGGNSVGLTPLQYLTWLQRPDVQGTFPLPEKRHDFLIWFYSHGPREHFLWDFMTTNERAPIEQLPEVQKARLISMVRRLAHTAPIPVPSAPLPFGVNVVGYAFGQLGIGEDGRMAARALLAAKVPCAMLDFPPGDDIQKNDRSMAAHVVEVANFSFNLFCLTAEENGRFYAEKGGSQFLGRYNIGYWPWELSQWPKDWGTILNLVDEVWVSTQHTYDALSPVCDKPLFLMPLAVDLGEITAFPTRHTARLHFGLPETAKLFCFAFDLNSSVDRKNPQACVDAFLAAFPTDQFSVDDVSLVIKVHKPKQHNAAWERLKLLAAQDSRIHIIEATLTRPDLLALYQACDCFISLHRAEGYGRGLAEAMQLGLHIICTGYSGNVDFCKPPFADLVNYTLVPLTAQQYPHSTGQVWAEPDVSHAASLMRAFVLDGHTPPSQQDWPQFSVNTLGEVYKKRLLEIWAG
jgi:glycosyltransferase involved in cell wall biosynthesis